MKKIGIYLVFFAVLIAGFWFVLGKNSTALDKRTIAISNVKPFSFTNYKGNIVNNSTINNKVYIAEFFFSTCPGICPQMNNNLKEIVYEKFKNDTNFLILSHTVTPQIDDLTRLTRYADSIGVTTNNWFFLTGERKDIYDVARISYTVDDPKNNVDDATLLHTQFIALVDKQKRVRAIYDATKKAELKECIIKINQLLIEK
jgi:protein SCO1